MDSNSALPPIRTREEEAAWLAAQLAEARELLQQRTKCHDTNNDMMALEWLETLWKRGFPLEASLAEDCVRRMRIAVERGDYPRELLQPRA